MESTLPKVLHRICGRTMLDHVLAAAREVDPGEVIVVVGDRREQVISHLREHAPDVRVMVQHHRGGTGHAVRTVVEEVGLDHGTVVVTYGDAPVLRGQTLTALVREHAARNAAATALTTVMNDPTGYGRILRDAGGAIMEIVEEADATSSGRHRGQLRRLRVRGGPARWVAEDLTDNARVQEYHRRGIRGQMATTWLFWKRMVEEVWRQRPGPARGPGGLNTGCRALERRGDHRSAYHRHYRGRGHRPDAEIGPCTQLEGITAIEAGARVGPGCTLRDTTVGAGAIVTHAVCESAVIGPGAVVGPFVHLPPGTRIGPGERVAAAAGVPASEGAH
jgi:bifunctional UDP-N-acetylglucosamine pyrophosphorylase/glucosamine-1-phosphate N-acetyltransferase